MTYALGWLAFFGLMTAQALGALFSCWYPWHHVDGDDSQEATSVGLAEERASAA